MLLVGTDTICFGAKDTIRASSPNNAPEVVANYVYDWWYSVDDTTGAPAHTGTTLFMDNVRENTTVVVRVTDTQNDFFRFGYFDVVVQAFPELTLTGDTLLCIGQNANISASDGTGNTIALQWTFNDRADTLSVNSTGLLFKSLPVFSIINRDETVEEYLNKIKGQHTRLFFQSTQSQIYYYFSEHSCLNPR